MFGSILQRMILWELTKVFVMSLVGITGILLMAGIIAEASQQGLGPGQILAAIPLLVPSTLPYTIPATTLFATCVVYGRLSADNEILAIKSAGINAIKIVRPGLLLGLAMSAATMGLYYRIIPYTHHLLRAMVFNDAQELLYSLLKKHGEIKYSSFPYQIFVKGVKDKSGDRKLLEPIFKRKDAQGVIDSVAHAREAELQVLPSQRTGGNQNETLRRLGRERSERLSGKEDALHRFAQGLRQAEPAPAARFDLAGDPRQTHRASEKN